MLKRSKIFKSQAGDTLIEALFAITIFSFIVVGALSLMNQGMSASRRSVEITIVRQQMDAQATTLRFLHDSYVNAYQSGATFNPTGPALEYSKLIQYVKNAGRTSASQFGGTAPCVVPSDSGKDFIMNPIQATMVTTTSNPAVFQNAPIYAQLTFNANNTIANAQGIWVEAIRSPQAGTQAGYIDFHIRACWDAPGTDAPMNLGTIVRLYEPRN